MSSRRTQLRDAGLTARPHVPTKHDLLAEPGLHPLELSTGVRDGRLFVPHGAMEEERPLILVLHGAGADASSMLRLLGRSANTSNCLLLAPDARKHTWDFLVSDLGPDVAYIDSALQLTFDRCRVDRAHIAIAGFSDGASYALTLGLANGCLFTHVMAFSPGFMRPPRLEGSPQVFLSHGNRDEVLPIDLCSRRIAPQLERLGLPFVYREFDGPHTVPDDILAEAMGWFSK